MRDFFLTVLPAQEHDLAFHLARKIDKSEVQPLELTATGFDLPQQPLDLSRFCA